MMLGCSTIHFTKNKDRVHAYDYSQWHHVGLFDFVEFSKPVNLKKICQREGQWSSVQVETGLVQWLIASMPYVGDLYSPKKVEVSCSQ